MLPKTSIDQYGRKTWDVDAYAAEAKVKRQKRDVIDELNHLSNDHDRDKMILRLLAAVSDFTLVDGDSMRYKVGFACPICVLLFRDNLALIDHFNLPQHLAKVGEDHETGLKRSTLEEVEKALRFLVQRKQKQEKECPTFQERVERRKRYEETKRQKRRAKKRAKTPSEHDPHDEILRNVMGFSKFGS